MRTSFQSQVQNARLIARDASGNNPILIKDITAPVANSNTGDHVLIATSAMATYLSVTPDFLITTPIPASYLAAGTLTFEQDPPSSIIYWRLSWGGAGYTGTGAGSTTNDADGNFNPPFGGPLPSSSTQALRFRFAATSASITNLNDYQLTPGAATTGAAALCSPTSNSSKLVGRNSAVFWSAPLRKTNWIFPWPLAS